MSTENTCSSKAVCLPAILLAAGASNRLGQPKQLLRVESEMLLDHAVRVTRAAGFNPVFVVLGAHSDAIQRAAHLEGCTILINSGWSEGMASSIRCGVRAVQEQCSEASGVLLLVCDQPALTTEHLQTLLAAHCAAPPAAIIASHYAGRPGVPILAPRLLFPQLLALTGDRGARDFLRTDERELVEIPFISGEWDIDRPEDMAGDVTALSS